MPEWVCEYCDSSLISIQHGIVEEINLNMARLSNQRPCVSIVIPIYNEGVSILNTVLSLSRQITQYPFEIICVDNNSDDRTAEIIKVLSVTYCFQNTQGCGPARQMGIERARGAYVLSADADGLYPSGWVQGMIDVLKKESATCVYGRYSYIETPKYKRYQLFFYELFKEVLSEIKNINRPYLNAGGISMGFTKVDSLEIGFDIRHIAGEDGRMCFDLMQRGKVVYVRSNALRVWTLPRSLNRKDGSFFDKIRKEIMKLYSCLYPASQHDTKVSQNS